TKIGYSLSTQCDGDAVQIPINLVDVDVLSSTESRACRRRSGSPYNLMSHELPAPSGYLRLEPALLLEQRTGSFRLWSLDFVRQQCVESRPLKLLRKFALVLRMN